MGSGGFGGCGLRSDRKGGGSYMWGMNEGDGKGGGKSGGGRIGEE